MCGITGKKMSIPTSVSPIIKVHVYELTHHEDNYDLRYRLKEKIHVPSSKKGVSMMSSASSKMPSTGQSADVSSEGTGEEKKGRSPPSQGKSATRV